MLERSASTISRELTRNRGQRGYRPQQAHGMAEARRAMNARTIDESTWQFARIGDWEADTIIGKNHRQAIVSLVERKTGFTLIEKAERKTAQAVSDARLLKPYRRQVHTITSDNGREFAGHEEIAQGLQADFYFAHPHASSCINKLVACHWKAYDWISGGWLGKGRAAKIFPCFN